MAIKKSLQIRSTLYKSIDASSLSQLSTIAEVNGLDAKALSAAFDKFMTVHRQDSTTVSTSDIEMFTNQYTKTAANNSGKSLAAARGSNLFHKGSWEDIDVATAAKDINTIAADLTNTTNAPNNNNTSSQRITPYMNKRPKRPSAATPHRQPTPPSSGKFKQRAQPGKVVSVLNPHILNTTTNGDATAAEGMDVDTISPNYNNNTNKSSAMGCTIQVMTTDAAAALDSTTTAIPKYMTNRLEDRAAYIERRITALEDDVEAGAFKHFFTCSTSTTNNQQQQQEENTDSSMTMTTPHPVAVSSQKTSIFIGRICCDAEEGRLNAQSLLLEGSMRTSRGERVRLEVNKSTSGYRLFPGQVVAIIGTNPSGYCVIADKVVPGLALPSAKTPLADLAAFYSNGSTDPSAATATALTMMIASGPYTASDDLAYEPLEALLSKAAEERPDTLILCGPFVDADHPLLRDGWMVDISFEDLYMTRVVGALERFVARPGCAETKIVVVPSVRDLHMHPVFPQPRQQLMGGSSMSDGGVVMHMTNPVTLKCNEIVVGACSADWLLAASSSETSMQPAATAGQQQQQQDRLGDLSAMLLSQRNYFPMYPAPLNVPLDAARGGAGGLDLPCSPDVLVSPSDLAPFAKLVSPPTSSSSESGGGVETVVINPGRLTRGVTGGTYAKVVIAPLKEGVEVAGGAAASTNAPVYHGIHRRCKVEIVKI